ncbi:hypothetical protein GOODEAATRI_002948 [Goodea atripinnis]|uniref:Uncharacterized protein n=1 Tax=Goodea atripinnis TaxID=208336 RepID=A0ABV0PKE7_9TELE
MTRRVYTCRHGLYAHRDCAAACLSNQDKDLTLCQDVICFEDTLRESVTLCHFSDSILEYLANLDKAPDPTVRKDTFSGEIYAAFDILFNNWLQSREHKLRLTVGEAVGSMCHLMASDKLEEQIPRIIPAIVSLYKKNTEHYVITSTMESKKLLILASIRQPMADHSNKVISAMAHHGYLELEGGELLVRFIVQNCALHDTYQVNAAFPFNSRGHGPPSLSLLQILSINIHPNTETVWEKEIPLLLSLLDDFVLLLSESTAESLDKKQWDEKMLEERNEVEVEKVKSTLILCYGHVALNAPSEKILNRIDQDILRCISKHFNTKELLRSMLARDPSPDGFQSIFKVPEMLEVLHVRLQSITEEQMTCGLKELLLNGQSQEPAVSLFPQLFSCLTVRLGASVGVMPPKDNTHKHSGSLHVAGYVNVE